MQQPHKLEGCSRNNQHCLVHTGWKIGDSQHSPIYVWNWDKIAKLKLPSCGSNKVQRRRVGQSISDQGGQGEQYASIQICSSAGQLQEETGLVLLSYKLQLTALRSEITTAGHKRQKNHKGFGHNQIKSFEELLEKYGEFFVSLFI